MWWAVGSAFHLTNRQQCLSNNQSIHQTISETCLNIIARKPNCILHLEDSIILLALSFKFVIFPSINYTSENTVRTCVKVANRKWYEAVHLDSLSYRAKNAPSDSLLQKLLQGRSHVKEQLL